ncbi:hypothetical protein EDD66_11191 [Mobilisporobacter senegalensis]|uniref:Uncharacterized protein n=1 Tax=Mobilisporobacter senegalensis TaxID=1329262 RepID=A0A3N1XF38_9FIRM|nr:hypothetical protein [Mobilisporobacter senegalensis]ROR25329.1 hypothetical protein EDD66_11191 [Mobilisporobacter senegalensis]
MYISYKIISPFYIIPSEIKELNENINIPFKFATPLEEYDFEEGEWERIEDYCKIFYSGSKGDYLRFNGYPDLSSTYKFTGIITDNPEVSFFGIHIGDEMAIAKDILKKYGYKCYNDDMSYEYYKGGIEFNVGVKRIFYGTDTEEYVDETVENISIQIDSTDWLRKGYYK